MKSVLDNVVAHYTTPPFDRLWEKFKEYESDPKAYDEKMRLRGLAEEQERSRNIIRDLRVALKREKKRLRESESNHERFLREIKQ